MIKDTIFCCGERRRKRVKLKCDVCGLENGSCNRYLMRSGREINICPCFLAFGCDEVSKAARDAHEEGRLIVEAEKKAARKKGRKR